uniref:Uncharacterized protein n=1 Tax=Anguilla anguilla TaxID=7936 RepID=A0A0E9TJP1_ANGAN
MESTWVISSGTDCFNPSSRSQMC